MVDQIKNMYILPESLEAGRFCSALRMYGTSWVRDARAESRVRGSCCSELAARRHWREPSFIAEYMSVASQLMLDAANAGRSMFFSAEPGTLSVNSNLS